MRCIFFSFFLRWRNEGLSTGYGVFAFSTVECENFFVLNSPLTSVSFTSLWFSDYLSHLPCMVFTFIYLWCAIFKLFFFSPSLWWVSRRNACYSQVANQSCTITRLSLLYLCIQPFLCLVMSLLLFLLIFVSASVSESTSVSVSVRPCAFVCLCPCLSLSACVCPLFYVRLCLPINLFPSPCLFHSLFVCFFVPFLCFYLLLLFFFFFCLCPCSPALSVCHSIYLLIILR